MIIDKYKALPDFPFVHYYENVEHYINRQAYWKDVLLSVSNFKMSDWRPTVSELDLATEMNTGAIYKILNLSERKEIVLGSATREGLANQIFYDNQAMDELSIEKAIQELNLSSEEIEDLKSGITIEDAQKEAEKYWSPFTAYVDLYDGFIYDVPESEVLKPFERLVLLSEISEEAEVLARQALELFLQDGPAMERVNSVFSPDEDE